MQTILGLDVPASVRYVIALAFVLALAAIGGVILRRISAGRRTLKGQSGGRARQPRLGVIDIYDLDRQRQLVLLRRDNVEHLVMIGGPTDVVVETNIVRGQGRVQMPGNLEQVPQDRAEPEMMVAPAAAAPMVAPPISPPPMIVPAALSTMPAVAAGKAISARPIDMTTDLAVTDAPTTSPAMAAPKSPPPMLGQAPVSSPVDASPPPIETPVATSRQVVQPRPASTPAAFAPTMPFPLEPTPVTRAPAADLDDMTRQLAEALQRPQAAVRSAVLSAMSATPPAMSATPEVPLPVPAKPATDNPSRMAPQPQGSEVSAREIPLSPVNPALAGNRALSFEELMGQQLSAAIDLRSGPGVEASTNVPAGRRNDSSPSQPVSTTPAVPMPQLPAALMQAVSAGLEEAVADSLGVVQATPSDVPASPREPVRDPSKSRPMTTPTAAPRPQQTSGLAGSEEPVPQAPNATPEHQNMAAPQVVQKPREAAKPADGPKAQAFADLDLAKQDLAKQEINNQDMANQGGAKVDRSSSAPPMPFSAAASAGAGAPAAIADARRETEPNGVLPPSSPAMVAKTPAPVAPSSEAVSPSAGVAVQGASPVQRDAAGQTAPVEPEPANKHDSVPEAKDDIKASEPARIAAMTDDPFSIDAIEQEFARLLGQGVPPKP